MPRPQPKQQKQRHDPLHVEIEQDDTLRKFGRAKNSKKRAQEEEEEVGVSTRMSAFELC